MRPERTRSEGAEDSRPGRQAGIEVRMKLSAESATLQESAKKGFLIYWIWICAAPSALISVFNTCFSAEGGLVHFLAGGSEVTFCAAASHIRKILQSCQR